MPQLLFSLSHIPKIMSNETDKNSNPILAYFNSAISIIYRFHLYFRYLFSFNILDLYNIKWECLVYHLYPILIILLVLLLSILVIILQQAIKASTIYTFNKTTMYTQSHRFPIRILIKIGQTKRFDRFQCLYNCRVT